MVPSGRITAACIFIIFFHRMKVMDASHIFLQFFKDSFPGYLHTAMAFRRDYESVGCQRVWPNDSYLF